MELQKKKTNWLQLISVVAIAFLVLELVLLIKQNRELRAACAQPPGDILKPGDHVEGFLYETLDNHSQSFQFTSPEKKYLFYILSPGCKYCENTLVQWKKISSNNNNSNLEIICTSLAPMDISRDYIVEKHIDFYTVAVESTFSSKYKVVRTPMTILINGNGSVQQVWYGELSNEQAGQVMALIGATNVPNN